ncbi:MAG: hypothetical protein SF097_02410 [Acidobacteriota bacterium]|nr:hypothetical protein [Acidobacteriota bacterium]
MTNNAVTTESTLANMADLLLARIKQDKFLRLFTIFTRIMLALGFLPSGWTKAVYERFTLLALDNPVGFFFEAMYQTGFYYRFIGIAQVTAAILLLIPRTALLGALIYFPIILNIFIITISMDFRGTPFITGMMLLGNVYLLCWDFDRLKRIFQP